MPTVQISDFMPDRTMESLLMAIVSASANGLPELLRSWKLSGYFRIGASQYEVSVFHNAESLEICLLLRDPELPEADESFVADAGAEPL